MSSTALLTCSTCTSPSARWAGRTLPGTAASAVTPSALLQPLPVRVIMSPPDERSLWRASQWWQCALATCLVIQQRCVTGT